MDDMWVLKYQDKVLKSGSYDDCFIALGAEAQNKGFPSRLKALSSKKFEIVNTKSIADASKKENATQLVTQLQEAVDLSLKNDLTWVPKAIKLLHSITNS